MPTLGEKPQRMGHAPPADGNDRRVAHMWNSKVNLKSKSLGCPHLAIFEKWGPDHLHNTRCNGVFPGKVLYVERGPTFANPRQTWATPRIKTSDPL